MSGKKGSDEGQRQHYSMAIGNGKVEATHPAGSRRFDKGGAVKKVDDDAGYQKYGSGFRKAPKPK